MTTPAAGLAPVAPGAASADPPAKTALWIPDGRRSTRVAAIIKGAVFTDLSNVPPDAVDEILPALLRLAQKEQPLKRAMAAAALGDLSAALADPESRNKVASALGALSKDSSRQVRRAAAAAMEAQARRAGVPTPQPLEGNGE